MKKLMIAAFAIAFAAVAQAATVTWKATSGYLYDGSGSTTKITSGDAYLMFVTTTFTQDNLVNAFASFEGDAGKTLEAMGSSGALASGTAAIAANGRIPEGVSTYSVTSDATAYFVVFANDKMYVSDITDAIYDAVTASSDASFANISASSKQTFDAADGFSAHGAGWYNVPEPTSALMLLVGLAGLALKRKVA